MGEGRAHVHERHQLQEVCSSIQTLAHQVRQSREL